MDEKQEMEWLEAQKISISADLVAAAERQLQFLAAVDRRRSLYDGPLLEWAIHRYTVCWLPLLAKFSESGVLEGSLVVPLDCEWIWHCHRLNPVQYRKDCQEFYGRILDNQNVESSLQTKSKHQTEEIWARLYPGEPFELNFSNPFSDSTSANMYSGAVDTITYDLVSAVKRQSSFYYQVSRPTMRDNHFLQDAVARYKGFLHLIKSNQERAINQFCVPTYDIDLIWHSHQLQPLSYCKDMLQLLGKVLEHDDTDSDRSKGKKLDTGFSDTTKQWEDTYGLRYWRAGAMYRGNGPSPLIVAPYSSNYTTKNEIASNKSQKFLHLPQTMVVEVLLEIVGVKNLSTGQKGNLFVSFSKKQPDMFLSGSCTLSISSESGKKLVAGFQCEPTGELVLALLSDLSSNTTISRPAKTIGTTSISLKHLMGPDSKLSIERWLELKPLSGNVDSKPVCLHVAASFTVPVPAPVVFRMAKPHPISMTTCLFPLRGKFQPIRRWTRFMDDNGNEIISVHMRNLKTTEAKENSISRKEVFGITRLSRKPCLLAYYAENKWSIKDSNFSLHIERRTSQGGYIFELRGDRQMQLFHGQKLEYEPKSFKEQTESGFITAVEFSAEYPYGKAVALLDMKCSLIEVNEEWFMLPGILLVFIFSNMFKKGGYNALTLSGEIVKEITGPDVEVERQNLKDTLLDSSHAFAMAEAVNELGSAAAIVKNNSCSSDYCDKCGSAVKSGGYGVHSGGSGVVVKRSSGCGSGCGDSCGNGLTSAKSSSCGSGCGGGCGNGLGGAKGNSCGSGCGGLCGDVLAGAKSGGCGSGCGGGCGNGLAAAKSGGCGSGCGGGCGNGLAGVKSGGCGSGCGGGCGNGLAGAKSGGCGTGCGGGCGNVLVGAKSGGCGSGCGGGGCGNGLAGAKSGGCGSGCGGGCGNVLAGAKPVGAQAS